MLEQKSNFLPSMKNASGRDSRGLAKPTFRVWTNPNCHTDLTFTSTTASVPSSESLRTLQISGIHVLNKICLVAEFVYKL